MIKVLQVVSGLNYGGVSAAIMNYYRNIDRDKVQFDFTSTQTNGRFEEEIKALGGKIHYLPSKFRHPFKYMKQLKKIIRENHYDIVHSNTNSASGYLDLLPAKQAGCKIRISHSHNTGCLIKWQHYIFKPILSCVANVRFACSKEAAKWMFGNKDYIQINNGIDFGRYAFSEEKRTEVREKCAWKENFVIGHVGTFQDRKNQQFLVSLMPELLKKVPDAKLVLVGSGETMDKVKNLAKEQGVEDRVEFLGNRPDVPDLMQGFDLFAFPSLAEGLSLVSIEAQATSLPMIINEDIPYICIDEENAVIRIPLDASQWIEKITKVFEDKKERKPLSADKIEKSGYDIKQIANNLAKEYEKLTEKFYEKNRT